MKLNGNTLLTVENLKSSNHHVVAINLLRDDAIDKGEALKIELITEKLKDIVEILGFDLTNDSIKDTPSRVAKRGK